MAICGALGFALVSYIPLCISYGSELTFPLQPALVNATLIMLGSTSSFILAIMGAYMLAEGENDSLLDPKDLLIVRQSRSKSFLSITIVTSIVAFVLSFVIKEDLKRLNYGKTQIEVRNEE